MLTFLHSRSGSGEAFVTIHFRESQEKPAVKFLLGKYGIDVAIELAGKDLIDL
jgi:hypothetical protein